ncbi:hypothetical protein [Microbacterium rhizophilus]|uniref:hypothetical protein n=1 Tax=Microbacterium rhizophilus TaxID=3138934 RepID=UPI0031F151C8
MSAVQRLAVGDRVRHHAIPLEGEVVKTSPRNGRALVKLDDGRTMTLEAWKLRRVSPAH